MTKGANSCSDIEIMTQQGERSFGIVVLAAGLGKRMRSPLPKVLHEIAGKPLLFHILNQIRESDSHASIALVVGNGREKVESYVRSEKLFQDLKISFVVQSEQLGTGHAAKCAMESEWGNQFSGAQNSVLILPGDQPLIPSELIHQMRFPLSKSEAARLLTCERPEPAGYGRIVRRGAGGPVIRIVEDRDATEKQKQIREVSTSIYLFRGDFLRASLKRLSNNNAQKEYYLTDLIEAATRARKKVGVLKWKNQEDLLGINDPWELAQAGKILNERLLKAWALKGVTLIDPQMVYIEPSVVLHPPLVLHPGVHLRGETEIGTGAVIGPNVVLKNVVIGQHVQLQTGTVATDSQIGDHANVGPYAHLRPGSSVGTHSKIGNFVELKKTTIGSQTSVAHLSYLGDAEVGKKVNIGCGFVTCNFDGRVIEGQRKHKTIIEDEVFMGSDCQTIAPVKIGKGAYIASGSTITEDVEPGAFSIARARQVNKLGYAKRLKNSE
ncbi:MAG: bifunctional UDP-N-acetylglucosamine diphosphorylase/glucosamine-1-phosphate N-acetyltransferase GlmU [Bdellovibrio sp.]|nr:bifunctional UDP-N-acetylglucosamine diphosphorylase/glucosamine-1-phosphate N-acetyltransferase GlmU [Bdellovibrio sp.]